MKKPSAAPARDQEVETLKRRVAALERTTAALSARMLSLFGAAPKPVEPGVGVADRPAFTSPVR